MTKENDYGILKIDDLKKNFKEKEAKVDGRKAELVKLNRIAPYLSSI